VAIFIKGKTSYAICGETIRSENTVFGTPQFVEHEPHQFSRYSDAMMHVKCFWTWPESEAFRKAFHEASKKMNSRFPQSMMEDGCVVDHPDLNSKRDFF